MTCGGISERCLPPKSTRTPWEREFFVEESLNERLVREVIQNSLDASIARVQGTGVPVRVRFSLEGLLNPLPPAKTKRYFTGLRDHLYAGLDDSAFASRIRSENLLEGDVPFLVVEDAGTIGLGGDWTQFDDSEAQSAQDNHFYCSSETWGGRKIG